MLLKRCEGGKENDGGHRLRARPRQKESENDEKNANRNNSHLFRVLL